MNTGKSIVVLGGGYGGILTAKKLAKKFKKDNDVKITLIDKNSYHTMLTELHEVAAGRVPEDGIRINFDEILAGRNVDRVLDTITKIDFENKTLHGEVSCTKYDYLVLGSGSKPTFFGNKGAEENAFQLWSYEDAVKIKHHMLEVFGKASVEADSFKRKRLLTFVVIGCGFTGIEMIGELAEWRERLCHTFNIDESEVRMIIADMLPRVLPNFHPKLIEKTTKRLKKMNVELMLESAIKDVQPDYIEIDGKGKIDTNTVIWAAGVEGSDIVDTFDKENIDVVGRNRVETDEFLRAKSQKDVFVVGDNIFFIPEGEERPVPQMVENAEHSSDLVAHNIVATVKDKELKKYKPEFHGAMVSIGGRYGVAQLNFGKTELVLSGFLAMFVKHFINFIYFVQVQGFHKLWKYWQQEFFHVSDNRSFLGGHFAKRSPNFFLVPLRLFLGGMWLYEGIDKIQKVIADPSHIFLLASKVDVTGATEEAAEAVQALPVPSFIYQIVDWFMNIFFYTPSGEFTALAGVFQAIIVAAEILIGLALIGGLFSALASIASVVLGIMIWSSGNASFEMLWYIFAGIALIGGSGSTFGCDYYVLPFLSRRWRKLKFVKKWYLYTDL